MDKFKSLLFLFSLSLLLIGCVLLEEEAPLPTVAIPTREDASTGDTAVAATATTSTQTDTSNNTDDPALTETAQPAVTPTLATTPTSEPTPTALPVVASLPIQEVSGPPLPASGRDLLFIADGALKKWNHRNGQIEILVNGPDPASRTAEENQDGIFIGDVTHFEVTADGRRAVVARRSEILTQAKTRLNQNDEEEEVGITFGVFEILFVDTVSGATWPLVSEVVNLRTVAISPNAEQVAFIASTIGEEIPLEEDTNIAPTQMFVIAAGGGPNPNNLRVVDSCEEVCSQPVWHIESNLVVWGDREALKLYNIAGSEAEILQPNRAEGAEPTGHTPLGWANNGRFLLTALGHFEGGSQAVFDVPTRTLIPIPNSFTYTEPYPVEIMWMPDDRLFILRTGEPFAPTAELWRVFVDDNNIVMEESLLLSGNEVGAMGQMHLEDGRFAFALVSENPDLAGLYHLTSLSQQPQKVNALPANQPSFYGTLSEVNWSSAGFGAIAVYDNIPYYGLAEAGVLHDMSAAFGADAHSFHWQPDIPLP